MRLAPKAAPQRGVLLEAFAALQAGNAALRQHIAELEPASTAGFGSKLDTATNVAAIHDGEVLDATNITPAL